MERFIDKLYSNKICDNLSENISKSVESFLSLKFSSMIRKEFNEWDAFKFGIIDCEGNIIKIPKTYEDKRYLGEFNNLVRKVRKIVIEHCEENVLDTLLAVYFNENVFTDNLLLDIKMEIAYSVDNKEIELLEKILIEMREKLK